MTFHPRCHRSGFTVLEILICVILVAATFNIAALLMTSIVRLNHEAPRAAAAMSAQGQWLAMMRADAWAAKAVDVGDGSHVTLGAVVWRVESGTLFREADGATSRWPCDRPLRWGREGGVLTVGDGASVIPLAMPLAMPLAAHPGTVKP